MHALGRTVGHSLLFALLASLGASGALRAQDPEAGQSRVEEVPAQDGRSPTASGVFGELSRDLTRLRRNSRFGVRLNVGAGEAPKAGVHLGEGLIAAPWSPDRELGERATVYARRQIFRAIKIGEIPNFLAIYHMRDVAHIEPLPEPRRFFADADQGVLGDLCLVLDPNRARISFLHEQRFRRSVQRSKGADEAENSKRKPLLQIFAYGLADTESRAGSAVVAADGSLVGVLVRPRFRENATAEAGADAKKPAKDESPEQARERQEREAEARRRAAEEQRERSGFAMVLDARMLWELGRKRAELFDATQIEPSIGVRLNPVGRLSAAQARSVRKQQAESGPQSGAVQSAGATGKSETAKKSKTAKKTEAPAKTEAPEKPGTAENIETAKKKGAGFVVSQIYAGSPAERAGVRRLDRWVELDGHKLESLEQIRAALKKLRPGGKLRIGYERGGKRSQLELRPD
jgi:membrane-associated protease RseP (regulator of RpoE activity)